MTTEATQLELPAELNIAAATDVKAMLLAVLDVADADLDIEGSAVRRVDAAGIQLLGALCQTLRRAGRAWRWSSPSEELAEAVQQLGMNECLEFQSPMQN